MIVLEIQQTGDNIATIITTYADKNVAEQKYHQVLSAAAVSAVPVHSCVMMYDNGHEFKRETYYHNGSAGE